MFALAAGVLAMIHGGFTVFDEQHNGGAGTSIVLAMVQIAALVMGRSETRLLTFLLGLAVAGRAVIRYALGAPFDWVGALVALVVVAAAVILRGKPQPATPT
ncbi:MAG: hypothetical protein BGN86_01735 [Caulobacterales bacterium 68-7]|nr:MAG: hypothetical protein BGN86_01735 [Caulobacterales bacterium 68-7]